jgi:hypothetical protein
VTFHCSAPTSTNARKSACAFQRHSDIELRFVKFIEFAGFQGKNRSSRDLRRGREHLLTQHRLGRDRGAETWVAVGSGAPLFLAFKAIAVDRSTSFLMCWPTRLVTVANDVFMRAEARGEGNFGGPF